eukprot:Opistho-2@15747
MSESATESVPTVERKGAAKVRYEIDRLSDRLCDEERSLLSTAGSLTALLKTKEELEKRLLECEATQHAIKRDTSVILQQLEAPAAEGMTQYWEQESLDQILLATAGLLAGPPSGADVIRHTKGIAAAASKVISGIKASLANVTDEAQKATRTLSVKEIADALAKYVSAAKIAAKSPDDPAAQEALSTVVRALQEAALSIERRGKAEASALSSATASVVREAAAPSAAAPESVAPVTLAVSATLPSATPTQAVAPAPAPVEEDSARSPVAVIPETRPESATASFLPPPNQFAGDDADDEAADEPAALASERHSLAGRTHASSQPMEPKDDYSGDDLKDSKPLPPGTVKGALRIYDASTTNKTEEFKTVSCTTATPALEVLRLALKKYHLTDDPSTYNLLEVKMEHGVRERKMEFDELPLKLKIRWEDMGGAADGYRLFMRKRRVSLNQDDAKGTVRVYAGTLKAVEEFKTLPLSIDTTAPEAVKLAMTKFKINDDPSNFSIVEVQFQLGFHERTLEKTECPLAIKTNWMKQGIKEDMIRFYLRKNKTAGLEKGAIRIFPGNGVPKTGDEFRSVFVSTMTKVPKCYQDGSRSVCHVARRGKVLAGRILQWQGARDGRPREPIDCRQCKGQRQDLPHARRQPGARKDLWAWTDNAFQGRVEHVGGDAGELILR